MSFARNLLQQAQLRLVGVRIDDGGFDVSAALSQRARRRARACYSLASVSAGHDTPVERRLALLDWAIASARGLSKMTMTASFHHRGLPPPALKSLDRSGSVLYAGSFSKVLFPGFAARISCPCLASSPNVSPASERSSSHSSNHHSEISGVL